MWILLLFNWFSCCPNECCSNVSRLLNVAGEPELEPNVPVDDYCKMPVGAVLDGHQSSDANDNAEEEETDHSKSVHISHVRY